MLFDYVAHRHVYSPLKELKSAPINLNITIIKTNQGKCQRLSTSVKTAQKKPVFSIDVWLSGKKCNTCEEHCRQRNITARKARSPSNNNNNPITAVHNFKVCTSKTAADSSLHHRVADLPLSWFCKLLHRPSSSLYLHLSGGVHVEQQAEGAQSTITSSWLQLLQTGIAENKTLTAGSSTLCIRGLIGI